MVRLVNRLFAALAAISIASISAVSTDELQCHEFPVVIVSAKNDAFPDPTCNQLRFPAADCLKHSVVSTISVVDHQDGSPNCYHSLPTHTYEAKTNYRGQTSLFYAKHQLGVRFDTLTEFIGFPQDTNFILNGPFADCSLLRNHLAHWLYRGTGRYSARTKHIAMYFSAVPDQTPRYVGIYLLIEKVGFGPNRVGLATMDTTCRGEEELNGGWAWHQDPAGFGDFSPNMVIDQYQNQFGMGERPILAYPSGHQTSQVMRNYFVNTTVGFLPQLYRFLWNNMTNPNGLETHLDLGSFADYILHTEMSLNVDAYRRSTYFHKDRNQTINAGPVWDLNLAYGNGARRHFHDWIYPQYTFWKRLMCNYKLTSLMIQRWTQLRQSIWSNTSIVSFLDKSAEPIRRQLTKCSSNWRTDVAQCAAVDLKTCNGTYEETLTDLKQAVLDRAQWMDQHIFDLYKPLNGDICSAVGDLPQYNCAANGSDDGCLTNPEPYYNAVTFPPIRKPYNGPACGSSESQLAIMQAQTSQEYSHAVSSDPINEVAGVSTEKSTDYCWLSSGVTALYPQMKGVRSKSLTPFCNGYGTCQQGANATCTCEDGVLLEPVSCRRIDAETLYEPKNSKKTTSIGENTTPVTAPVEEVTGVHLGWKRAILSGTIGMCILGLLMVATVNARTYRASRGERLTDPFVRPVRYGSINERSYLVGSPRS